MDPVVSSMKTDYENLTLKLLRLKGVLCLQNACQNYGTWHGEVLVTL